MLSHEGVHLRFFSRLLDLDLEPDRGILIPRFVEGVSEGRGSQFVGLLWNVCTDCIEIDRVVRHVIRV